MKNKQALKAAARLLQIQLGISVICAIFALGFYGWRGGFSALLGGLVCALPNAYFARKAFQFEGARAARQIVTSFYAGEALKITLATMLFVLVFRFCKIIPWIFFAVYVGVQMVLWFAPIIFKSRQK